VFLLPPARRVGRVERKGENFFKQEPVTLLRSERRFFLQSFSSEEEKQEGEKGKDFSVWRFCAPRPSRARWPPARRARGRSRCRRYRASDLLIPDEHDPRAGEREAPSILGPLSTRKLGSKGPANSPLKFEGGKRCLSKESLWLGKEVLFGFSHCSSGCAIRENIAAGDQKLIFSSRRNRPRLAIEPQPEWEGRGS